MNDRHPTLPALREFLRGYLHEDCIAEYGSLEGAARRFVQDADQQQRNAVAAEWRQFREQTKSLPLERFNEALRATGSGCAVARMEEIKKITSVLLG
jgi:hypothetical protein